MKVFLFGWMTILFLNISVNISAQNIPVVPLRDGMVITHSVIIKKGIYKLNGSNDLKNGAIVIDGNNIVVDFNGSVLQGASDKTRPDNFSGVGIYVKPGSAITIKNAKIKGYKIGLLAKHVKHILIDSSDLSNNFRQHLNSNRLREDLSDWQSYHDNEKDQWMRFGAGIYLKNCDSLIVKNSLITQGQCGLMMVGCKGGNVYNNNFSFNSGIGMGLYRSSFLRLMNNKVDWNVRGVSDGYYYRGQDAAAILVYEQSSHNVIAFNSATHSGDGIFLWAGYSTLETGLGGSNDNLIYGNDFSFAPANGVEATFSRNRIIDNYIEGCDYGVWAGYSHHTLIQGNEMKSNSTGIAIEQGQDNQFIGNQISDGRTGIQLWSTPGRVMSGQYDKRIDVFSKNYKIDNNSFSGLKKVFSFSNSKDIEIKNNSIKNSVDWIQIDTTVKNINIKNNGDNVAFKEPIFSDTLLRKPESAKNSMLPKDYFRGRKYIMMTQWGPYDFRSPILWWVSTDPSGKMHFEIQGPKGKWEINKSSGVNNLSSTSGTVPGVLSFDPGKNETIDLQLEFNGSEVVSPFGKKYRAGVPYLFGYQKVFFNGDWKVKLFTFDSTNDPVKYSDKFSKLLEKSNPILETSVGELDNNYWDGRKVSVPSNHTAMVAERTINFPKGKYVIGVTASEMVTVFVDGKKVIDARDASQIHFDADYHHEIVLPLKGKHTIKIVQANYGDYRMLYATINPIEDFNVD